MGSAFSGNFAASRNDHPVKDGCGAEKEERSGGERRKADVE